MESLILILIRLGEEQLNLTLVWCDRNKNLKFLRNIESSCQRLGHSLILKGRSPISRLQIAENILFTAATSHLSTVFFMNPSP